MVVASTLSKINLVAIILLVAAVCFLLWRLEVSKGEVATLENKIVAVSQSLDKANLSITKTNEQIDLLAQSRKKHEAQVLNIATKAGTRIARLEENRAREATVIAKPTLVENRINAAFQKSQKDLACVTGNIELCEKQ